MTTLTAAQWNRTVLARQHLLARADEDAVEVIDRCVGLGSRDPQAAFFSLWTRIADFEPAELDGLLTDREVVRLALQRGATTLIDGLDARWIHALVRSAPADGAGTDAAGVDPEEVAALAAGLFSPPEAGGVATADSAVSGAEIREALQRGWPDVPLGELTAMVRARLPLVQVPPRGLWRCREAAVYHLLDHWIGAGEPMVCGDEAARDLIRMYLRGRGPASAAAITAWSGLPRSARLLTEMVADWELAELTGPDGQTLYDLEGLPTASGEEAAPARLLAPYDAVLTANADRIALADPAVYAAAMAGAGGRSPGFILVDGRLAGTWALDTAGAVPTVRLRQLADLQPAQRAAVEREAAALTAFAVG